jgi:hypothetical protein
MIECPLRDFDVAESTLYPRSEIMPQIVKAKVRDTRAVDGSTPFSLNPR